MAKSVLFRYLMVKSVLFRYLNVKLKLFAGNVVCVLNHNELGFFIKVL